MANNNYLTKKSPVDSLAIKNAWAGIFVGIAVILSVFGIDIGEDWIEKATLLAVGVVQVIQGFIGWYGRYRVGDIR